MFATVARILVVLLLGMTAAHAETWSRYQSSSIVIDLPTGSFELIDHQSRRLHFEESDANAALDIFAGDTGGMAPREFRSLVENADPSRLVTYRAGGPTWFVLSGYMAGETGTGELIYYAKFLLSRNSTEFVAFEITYPRKAKAFFDPIVIRLERSLAFPR